ncbi:MAG: hypothetical protein KGN32_13310 [Burkholderiales bacterium]|nr:hypothetical protein [Burkholderiales bacterium]
MMQKYQQLMDRLDARTQECDVLHDTDMVLQHGPVIWKARSFAGTPHFYPVYKFEDLYSHSLLALILQKRSLVLNEKVLALANTPGFACVMSNEILDREITRVGGPHGCGYSITDVSDFAQCIATALCEDMARIEGANPGYTNVILCGGSDSLNLLLLPWKNPVIAISAEPNFEHVQKFVAQNDLNIPVKKLEDEFDANELEDEVLECCCRVDLAHWRWGAGLRRLARDMGHKLVYWKGQAGDLYMSTTWKAYMHPIRPAQRLVRRVYRKTSSYMPQAIARSIGHLLQPSVVQASWNRTASLQGSHMGFIREIADCLTVSAYHGPAVMKVWAQADLASVAQTDMRPLVGRILLGRDVIYPTQNPAPGPSQFRVGLSSPERFLSALKQTGIAIR